jgi:type IV pilus assembly protein PilC
VLLIILVATGVAINKAWKTSLRFQQSVDRWMLRIPILGEVFRKAAIARWARTLSTMFAAGVPLVEALNSVGGAAGNYVYELATKEIQLAVTTGTPMRRALENTGQFPALVVQMVAIGEETGALDPMLNRVADFYENEVDNVISGLSSLMEPVIMVVLGVLIGGLVIAMYMPIFKMGQAI